MERQQRHEELSEARQQHGAALAQAQAQAAAEAEAAREAAAASARERAAAQEQVGWAARLAQMAQPTLAARRAWVCVGVCHAWVRGEPAGSLLVAIICAMPLPQLQVNFLRSQLQFALQESEAESLELQQQLAAAAADAAALRESLRAAGERGSERDALVAELSGTVQQQQARMQVRPGRDAAYGQRTGW